MQNVLQIPPGERFYYILQELKREFPKFRLIPKEKSKRMTILAMLVYPINKNFLSSMTVTIRYTVFMPSRLIGTQSGARVLFHEAAHLKQWKRWKFLCVPTYIFLPIPIFLSWRAYWEFQAYSEGLRYDAYTTGFVSNEAIECAVRQFTSPEYFWMFPFPFLLRPLFKRRATRYIHEIQNGVI